jgi:hypothetical protein
VQDYSHHENNPTVAIVGLTQGASTVIDAVNLPLAEEFGPWWAWWAPCTCSFYAVTKVSYQGERRKLYLHQLLTGCGFLGINGRATADHIFHDTLDNRSSMLRIASPAGQSRNSRMRRDNSTGWIGVSFDGRYAKPWRAHLTVNGKRVLDARFDSELDALYARERAAIKHHAEFAVLNLPPGELPAACEI